MAWSGIAMRSTWKPSTDDPSGRTPLELKGVHQSRKPRLDQRRPQHHTRRVTGSGTHLSVHCGERTSREKYWTEEAKGAPPRVLYQGDNARTFGEIASKNNRVLKKILALS